MGSSDWALDYGEDWPSTVGRLLIIDQPRGELLAVITPPGGMSPGETIARLETLDRLFAMLPPGAHPFPVN